MYVEGHVRATSGAPIPGAVIETWETDDKGERDARPILLFPTLIPSMRRALLPLLSLFYSKASTILSMRIASSRTAAVGL